MKATLLKRLQPGYIRDFLISAGVVCMVFLISAEFDLAERFISWSEPLDDYEVDELPLVFLAMAAMAIWFSGRRMRDLKSEIRMRIQAEMQAGERLQMYKTLFEEGLSGNVITDLQGHVLLCNQAFLNMSGMSSGQATPINLARALGSQWKSMLEELSTCDYLDFPELTLQRTDGALWVVMVRFRKANGLGNQEEIHGYFTDITEQHLAEKELAGLLIENQALSRHAMQLQEEERSHLAREIHDDLGQYLTAIRLDATILSKHPQNAAEHAMRIAHHTGYIQTAVRRIINRLRPAALDAHGLVEAVYQLVRTWREQNPGTICHLELDESCSRLPDNLSIVMYRLIQEALTNIARHAQATEVWIIMHRINLPTGRKISIVIHDDGIGFKPLIHHGTFGISGMRERVESVQGQFEISSASGGGVKISAIIPDTHS